MKIHEEIARFANVADRAWFDGETIRPKIDDPRLRRQAFRVFAVMTDGEWRTLHQIHLITWRMSGKNDSEAAISARLRDFRKPRFGGYTVERRRVGTSGLFEYRLQPPKDNGQRALL